MLRFLVLPPPAPRPKEVVLFSPRPPREGPSSQRDRLGEQLRRSPSGLARARRFCSFCASPAVESGLPRRACQRHTARGVNPRRGPRAEDEEEEPSDGDACFWGDADGVAVALPWLFYSQFLIVS